MSSIEQKEIIKREISRKIKRLAALEKDQSINDLNIDNDEFKVSRKIYACFDGFIIFRSFSKENIDPFELVISSDRLGMFLRNQFPIKTKNGLLLSFYKLINPVIGLDWKIGTKVDIGSKSGGVKINEFHINGFQLMIFSYKEMEQIKETLDDIEFIIYSNDEIQKLTEENNELKITINNLNSINEPLIITEGKTDWKHFISALRHFHSINEFVEIQEKWFLKFGSKEDILNNVCNTNFEFENNVSKLNKLLDSYIEARTIDNNLSKSVRIGIFDSDDSKAKARFDNENKIYSFLIQPNDISTEFLYSENEIKSQIDGKRLFIGTEFNEKTKRLKENSFINLGGDNNNLNKAGRNVIVDSDVYNEEGINLALTKEKFAQQIYYKEIIISDESLCNFRHIFSKISGYINKEQWL